MIDDFIDKLVQDCIPPKKYSSEWNNELMKEKIKEIFNLELPIDKWFDEEGVDEDEIKKDYWMKLSKNIMRKNINIQKNY